MISIKTIESIRELVDKARGDGKSIGFVPTMGALHRGHVSLIEAAVNKCDFVVVSIFVNPTQFGPSEDLGKYPRDMLSDSKICDKAGADVIFAPSVEEMYPKRNVSWVTVEKLTEKLCGKSRPGHFRGVTTVCAKLFNIVNADVAFFGQKDAQQAVVIKQMVRDLNMPLEIVVCATVRAESGLAVSSRNQYLTESERKDAALLYAALKECESLALGGQCNCRKLIEAMQEKLAESEAIEIDYITIVDVETLENLERIDDKALVAMAVKVGSTRLIDNIIIELDKQ